jgi:hypothetical protein
MTVHWICRAIGCGWESESGREAFQHRKNGDNHHPTPVPMAEELQPQLMISRSDYNGLRIISAAGEA